LMTCLPLPQDVHRVMCHLAQCKFFWIALSSLEAKASEDIQEALWGSQGSSPSPQSLGLHH